MIIESTGNSFRWHCKLLIAVICVFLIGTVLMMAGPRSGLENIHAISDLNSLYVRIPYAAGDVTDHRTPEELSEVYRNSHQQNVDTASKAEVVMIVTAAEELELTTASIGQKVRIDRILRGDVSIQEGDTCTVWLASRLYGLHGSAEEEQKVQEGCAVSLVCGCKEKAHEENCADSRQKPV